MESRPQRWQRAFAAVGCVGEQPLERGIVEDHAQRKVKAWEVLGDKGFREAERLLSELENPV